MLTTKYVLSQKSNHDRNVNIVHSQDLADNIAFDGFDNQHDEQEQNQTMQSLVTVIETVHSKVPHQSFHQSSPIWPKWSCWIIKYRYQEKIIKNRTLSKIKLQLDYSMNVTESVLKKLKRDLKENQKESVKFICDFSNDMQDDNGFIALLANSVGYKQCQLKQILKDKKLNKRNSKFTSTDFQEIYDFWLDNSINSNESAYNMKCIKKRSFLK